MGVRARTVHYVVATVIASSIVIIIACLLLSSSLSSSSSSSSSSVSSSFESLSSQADSLSSTGATVARTKSTGSGAGAGSAGVAAVTDPTIMATIFGTNMVLQRRIQAVVYGWWTVGAVLTLTINGSETYRTVITNSDGSWSISLRPHEASFSNTIAVSDQAGNTQTIVNVAFGEVIFCSGQANMEYALPQSFGFDVTYDDDFPGLRWWTTAPLASTTPVNQILNREAAVCGKHTWCVANPWNLYQGLGVFDPSEPLENDSDPFGFPSGVCYYTTRNLYLQLNQTVPVGSVTSALSASPIEAYGSTDAWLACPTSSVQLPLPEFGYPPQGGSPYYYVSLLWNGMITALLQMRFSSIVWYQGEGNSDSIPNSLTYSCQIVALINDWRAKFNQVVPFVVILITPWADAPVNPAGFFEWGRMAQLNALSLANTSVTNTIDLGDSPDLDPIDHGEHPESKNIVGRRVFSQLWDMYYRSLYDPSGPLLPGNGPHYGAVSWPSVSNNYTFTFDFSTSPQSILVPFNNSGLNFRPTYKCVPPDGSTDCCDISPFVAYTYANKNPSPFTPLNTTGYRLKPVFIKGGSAIQLQLSKQQFNEGVYSIGLDYEGYPACALFNSAGLPHYPFNITGPYQVLPVQPAQPAVIYQPTPTPNPCPASNPYLCVKDFSSSVCFQTPGQAANCRGQWNSWCALSDPPSTVQFFLDAGIGGVCSSSSNSSLSTSTPSPSTSTTATSTTAKSSSTTSSPSSPSSASSSTAPTTRAATSTQTSTTIKPSPSSSSPTSASVTGTGKITATATAR